MSRGGVGRRWWQVSVGALTVLATGVLWLVGDRTLDSLVCAAAAMGGAAVVVLVGRSHPVAAVAVVFTLASATRFTLETPVGTLRLEQPSIVALVALAAVRVGRDRMRFPRAAWIAASALLVYLATLALSSTLVAPEPSLSLRMTLWWALSMAAGAATYVLLRSRTASGRDALVAVGSGFAVLGLATAVVFAIAGPAIAPGIQDPNAVQPRVYGVGWEANLYASYLAALLILAAGAVPRRGPLGLVAVAILALAFPLGVTRAAWLGLVAGALAMAGVIAWRARHQSRPLAEPMARAVATCLVALTVGVASVSILLPSTLERAGGGQAAVPLAPPATATPTVAAPVASPVPASPGTMTPAPTAGPTPTPTPAPNPVPTLIPVYDTIGFRLARVRPAIEDFATSPLIGLGAYSFGQRHLDASQGGAPDHLPILVLAAPYESGVIGAAALALAIGLLLWGLWRRSRSVPVLAGSLAGSLISLLVAYQATNALHFSTNWVLLGLAAALAWGPLAGRNDEPATEPDH